MSIPVKTQKVLALIGLLAILGGVGAAAFFFGGFFNVAANHPDPGMGTSKNHHRSRAAWNLLANDSGLFPFRFCAVHPKDAGDCMP